MNSLRIERICRALGIALILVYLAARLHSLVMPALSLWVFQARESAAASPVSSHTALDSARVDFALWSPGRIREYKQSLATAIDPPLALLSVPRVHIQVPLLEGTDDLALNRGAGRILGTAHLGEPGNIGVAGHRDGFFRALKDIRQGDLIQIRTLDHRYVYLVEDLKIVAPEDVSVLKPHEKSTLTLVTCYPFYYVGPAPQRFIVTAALASTDTPPVQAAQVLPRSNPPQEPRDAHKN